MFQILPSLITTRNIIEWSLLRIGMVEDKNVGAIVLEMLKTLPIACATHH